MALVLEKRLPGNVTVAVGSSAIKREHHTLTESEVGFLGKYMTTHSYDASCQTCNNCGSGDCNSCCSSSDE